jgi:predicted transcriptional regulator of viral defense system
MLLNLVTNEQMTRKGNTLAQHESAHSDRLLALTEQAGFVRPKDLEARKIPRIYLQRLVARGELVKHGRGLYGLPDAKVTEHHSFAQACKRVPHGVVCLLSALRYHGLTTQTPHEVWMALDRTAWSPQVEGPKLRVVRFSGMAMTAGIEKTPIEGVSVRVYGVAKTVADCFKYRNKIGIDVAVEALRDAWRQKRCTMDALWRYAKICRVGNVMRPYLEMLT